MYLLTKKQKNSNALMMYVFTEQETSLKQFLTGFRDISVFLFLSQVI